MRALCERSDAHVQWKSIHCGYVPEEEPAPPPSSKLVIEPQVDPIQAEKMFTEYVDQLAEKVPALRYLAQQRCHG